MTDAAHAADEAARSLTVARTIPAPRPLLWQALTDPAQLDQWWGPKGFTTTTHAIDIRPGGSWRFTMHGVDGMEFPNLITYHDLSEPARLVYTHGDGEAVPGEEFHTVITLTPGPGGTTVTLRSIFPTVAAREAVEGYAVEGGQSTLACLEEHVLGEYARLDAPAPVFSLRFTLDAPRERVFAALTQTEHLAQWWGPVGLTMQTARSDPRPGGRFHYGMRAPDGSEMWGKFTFYEVVAPALLVFTNSFSDPDANTTRAPFLDGVFPLEVLNTWILTEQDGQTVLALTGVPYRATPAEHAAYAALTESMTAGFGATLQQLTRYLARSG